MTKPPAHCPAYYIPERPRNPVAPVCSDEKKSVVLPPIVLPEEVYRAINERLPFADFVKVMSWPLPRQMPGRLFRDACILRRAGFDEWVCEMIIRARCSGLLRGIPDAEFIAAAQFASECITRRTTTSKWDPFRAENRRKRRAKRQRVTCARK